jgi:hypothetical protein
LLAVAAEAETPADTLADWASAAEEDAWLL